MATSSELALILQHTVDIGIDRLPVAGTDFGYQTGEHLTDVLTVFLTHVLRQHVGRCVPSDSAVNRLMGEDTQRLPAIVVDNIDEKELFDGQTVILLRCFMVDKGTERHETIIVVADEQTAETGSLLLRHDMWNSQRRPCQKQGPRCQLKSTPRT